MSTNDTQNNDGDKYVPQPVLNVLRSKFFGANVSPAHTPKDRRKNPSKVLYNLNYVFLNRNRNQY